MKLLIPFICAGLLFAVSSHAANLFSIKGPIDMNYGTSPRFAVIFNHSTHKQVKCRTCHHIKDEEGQRFVKCTREDCHSIPGARERDPMSMFMAYHAVGTDRSCYGCHRMEAKTHPQFVGCRPCHMGPLTRKALAEQAAKPE